MAIQYLVEINFTLPELEQRLSLDASYIKAFEVVFRKSVFAVDKNTF
jgi:hypothetical protein